MLKTEANLSSLLYIWQMCRIWDLQNPFAAIKVGGVSRWKYLLQTPLHLSLSKGFPSAISLRLNEEFLWRASFRGPLFDNVELSDRTLLPNYFFKTDSSSQTHDKTSWEEKNIAKHAEIIFLKI